MSAYDPKRTFDHLEMASFIGRIERGFDFLGYHFSAEGLTVAKHTIVNFIDKASRLYEQEQRAPGGVPRLEMYVRRWRRWMRGGLAWTVGDASSGPKGATPDDYIIPYIKSFASSKSTCVEWGRSF